MRKICFWFWGEVYLLKFDILGNVLQVISRRSCSLASHKEYKQGETVGLRTESHRLMIPFIFVVWISVSGAMLPRWGKWAPSECTPVWWVQGEHRGRSFHGVSPFAMFTVSQTKMTNGNKLLVSLLCPGAQSLPDSQLSGQPAARGEVPWKENMGAG